MKSKRLFCLTLALSGSCFGLPATVQAATNGTSRIYHDTHRGFQLAVPQGWTATKTNFEVFHYNEVFLTLDNRRPDLAVREQWFGSSMAEFNNRIAARQLQPGEAYMSIGYFDGPGGPMMQPDGVREDLLPMLRGKGIVPLSGHNLFGLALHFFKRGHSWNISAYLRAPVTTATSNQVMSILTSFRFETSPVANVAWAESLAWRELPEEIRMMGGPGRYVSGWPVVSYVGQRPLYGMRSLLVERTHLGYSVRFILTGLGSWAYGVSTNGSVQPGPVHLHAVSPRRSLVPSDLPGKPQGRIDAYWVAPYVLATKIFGKTTIAHISSHGHSEKQTAARNSGRTAYDEFHPKPGWVALRIRRHGQIVHTVGPFLPCYPSDKPVVNDDGSAAWLVWADTAKTTARIIAFDTNGNISFQTDCGGNVWSPIVAPDAAGVLLQTNGGPNANTFMWFTEKGKMRSMNISPNPECVGWIPRTSQSLFSVSFAGQSGPYELIDWKTGKRLWRIPCPGRGQTLAVGLTPEFILFSVAEPYPSGEWHKFNDGILQSGKEWVRTFYAVDVGSGKVVAHWCGQFPHRWYDADDHFSQLGGKLFYVTANEFTELDMNDILSKTHGWK